MGEHRPSYDRPPSYSTVMNTTIENSVSLEDALDAQIKIQAPKHGKNTNEEVPEISHKGLSVFFATVFLVGEIAGAGILNIAAAILNTGWGGMVLMTVVAIAVCYVGTRLAHCWIMVEELWPEYKSVPCRRPYPTIGYRALGTAGKWLAEICLLLTLYGASTVYMLVSANFLYTFLSDALPQVTSCSWTVIVSIILIPFTWFGSPKDFWPASIGAVIGSLFAVCVIITEVLIQIPDHRHPVYPKPTLESFFLGFGSILFSFGGASVFPTIQNDMKDRRKFPRSVSMAYALLFILYGSVATVCYIVLGDEIQSNILMSVDGVAVQITQGLLLAHFLFAFTIAVNPVMQTFEESLKIPAKFGIGRCLARTFIVGLILVAGLAVPNFSKILDLIGGSTVTVMSFVLPPLSYLRLASKKDSSGNKLRHVSILETGLLIIVLIVGIAGGVISTKSAISEITAPGAFNSTCFSRSAFMP